MSHHDYHPTHVLAVVGFFVSIMSFVIGSTALILVVTHGQ